MTRSPGAPGHTTHHSPLPLPSRPDRDPRDWPAAAEAKLEGRLAGISSSGATRDGLGVGLAAAAGWGFVVGAGDLRIRHAIERTAK